MLHAVVIRGEIDDAQLLLRTGASPNEPGERDFTPVDMSALMENLALLKILLIFGSDLSAQNDDGNTPIEVARLVGFEKGCCIDGELDRTRYWRAATVATQCHKASKKGG